MTRQIAQFGLKCLRAVGRTIAAITLFGAVAYAQAGFTFKHEPRALGSADILGYAIWTVPVGVMAIGTSSVPLRLDFTTDPRPPLGTSPLGRGWSMPFFASGVVEEDQTTARWHRPDGRIFYFSRERGNQEALSGKPSNVVEFISTEASWKAVKDVKTGAFILTNVADGTRLIYEDGLLTRFCFTESTGGAPEYVISYNRLRHPLRLSIAGVGTSVVEFFYGDGRLVNAVRVGDQMIKFSYSDSVMNNFSLGPYLAGVWGENSTQFEFKYTAIESRANRIDFIPSTSMGNAGISMIEWAAASGFILRDDLAKYSIDNSSLANGGRPVKTAVGVSVPASVERSGGVDPYNWRPDEAKVTRGDSSGVTEYRHFDRSRGISTTRSAEGVTKLVYFSMAQGPMMNKIRKIEEIRSGKVKLIERNAYDERGRLVRKIDEVGDVIINEYSSDGGVVRTFRNGMLYQEAFYVGGMKSSFREYVNGESRETIWSKAGAVEKVTTKINEEIVQEVITEFDSVGRRKRYEQKDPSYKSEFEYSENGGHSERRWSNGRFLGDFYFNEAGKMLRSSYSNGSTEDWVRGGAEAIVINKKLGSVKSISRVLNDRYIESVSSRQDMNRLVDGFIKKYPSGRLELSRSLDGSFFK